MNRDTFNLLFSIEKMPGFVRYTSKYADDGGFEFSITLNKDGGHVRYSSKAKTLSKVVTSAIKLAGGAQND